jgi:hypothetical protein
MAEIDNFTRKYNEYENEACAKYKDINLFFSKNFTSIYNSKCINSMRKNLSLADLFNYKSSVNDELITAYTKSLIEIDEITRNKKNQYGVIMDDELINVLMLKSDSWSVKQLCNPTLFVPSYVTGLVQIVGNKVNFACHGFYGTGAIDNMPKIELNNENDVCDYAAKIDVKFIYKLYLSASKNVEYKIMDCNDNRIMVN